MLIAFEEAKKKEFDPFKGTFDSKHTHAVLLCSLGVKKRKKVCNLINGMPWKVCASVEASQCACMT